MQHHATHQKQWGILCAKHPKHPSLNQNPQVRRHAAPYIKWATRPSPPVSFWSSISSWSPKFFAPELNQETIKKPLKKTTQHFCLKWKPNHEKNKWTYLSQGFASILFHTSLLLHEPKHQSSWLVWLQGLASLLNKAHLQPDLPSHGFNQNSAYFLLKNHWKTPRDFQVRLPRFWASPTDTTQP